MKQLTTCSFVDYGHHIILHGDSGNGKNFIGFALENVACRRFKRVRYICMKELLENLALARLEGNYRKVVNAYKKLDLLILDEFLIRKLTEEHNPETEAIIDQIVHKAIDIHIESKMSMRQRHGLDAPSVLKWRLHCY